MKQKSLLDYIYSKPKVYECEYCHKTFLSKKGYRIHRAKKHEIYSDEDIHVVEVDNNHIQINIKIRKALYNDLMKKVKRAKTDLANFLLEAFTFGDFLFDENVKAYIAQKGWQIITDEIRKEINGEKKTTYIQ